MATIKTKGIIIKRINLGEADRILTIITQDRGKIRAIAKGSRKSNAKLSGFLEMFRYNDCLIAEGRNLDIITSAQTIDTLHGISRDLRSVALAYYIAEMVDRLVEETQEVDGIFDLTFLVLNEISKGDLNLDLLKSFFEINILSLLGLHPELNYCVECRKSVSEGCFSFSMGGLLCDEHSNSDPVSMKLTNQEIGNLKSLLAKEVGDIHLEEESLSKITQVCSNFLDYILDRELRTKEFLSETADFY